MKVEDEEALFRRLALAGHIFDEGRDWPRVVIEDLKLVPKAAWRTLEKWSDKGWYEWGVVIDLGWLTKEGLAEAERRGYEVRK